MKHSLLLPFAGTQYQLLLLLLLDETLAITSFCRNSISVVVVVVVVVG